MGDRKHTFASFIKGTGLSKPKSATTKAKPVKPISRRSPSPSAKVTKPKAIEEKYQEPKEVFIHDSGEFPENKLNAWRTESDADYRKDSIQTTLRTSKTSKPTPQVEKQVVDTPYEPPSEADLIGTKLQKLIDLPNRNFACYCS